MIRRWFWQYPELGGEVEEISTLVVPLAQFLALRGYRVCVIDCDSRAYLDRLRVPG
ncbi:hypothetical protein PE067_06520 [Paracoccus sp. DMF-8]|uniref:hypothetical protein n=1 Tax=Paracoccus sp. DMF-8 TaxID=3019445 RepID=UPI0023E8F161|nr:hypothetical protein [Paracoccus sp. DMF-8]MDF3605830.1 hypothetical protein [Paracoccus sp. DMF-8]